MGRRGDVQDQQGKLQAGEVPQPRRARREAGDLRAFRADEPDAGVRQLQRGAMERLVEAAAAERNGGQLQSLHGGGRAPSGKPDRAVRTAGRRDLGADRRRAEGKQSKKASRPLLCPGIEKTGRQMADASLQSGQDVSGQHASMKENRDSSARFLSEHG